MFELEPEPEPPVAGPCTPGELPLVIPGSWEAGTVDGNAVTYIGYRDAASDRLYVQAISDRAERVAIPQVLSDPGEGRGLRMFGQHGPASLSLELVLDGFTAIVAHTITETALSLPGRLAGPGNQCSNSVTLARGDNVIAAFRNEITASPSLYKATVQVLDAALNEQSETMYELVDVGEPRAIVGTTEGFLLQTDDTLRLLDFGGQLTGAPIAIGGAELIQLVESTPDEQPMLARGGGGGVELVTLTTTGELTESVIVTSGGAAVTSLAARATTTGTLVLWQDAEVRLARITTSAPTPASLPVKGDNVVARAVVQGAAGPLVYIERDATIDQREIVAVQVCGQ